MPAKKTTAKKPAGEAKAKPRAPRESVAERKSKEAQTRARENRIAAGIIAGEKIKVLGEREGISQRSASTIANSSGVTQIIGELLREEAQTVHSLFRESLSAIGNALKAERFTVIDKCLVPLGADHFARLTACKRLLEFLTIGRATPKPEEDEDAEKPITATELKKILADHADKKA